MMPRAAALLALLLAALSMQEPESKPSAPPPSQGKPLPPVPDPPRTPIERRDLLQRFTEPSPLEGFYRLVGLTQPGVVGGEAQGYLVIGRKHLSIHLEVLGIDGDESHQSAFRSYRTSGPQLLMSTLCGFSAGPGRRSVLVDSPGIALACTYSLLGTALTLELDDRTVLKFERLE
jgi:hypothetical protein